MGEDFTVGSVWKKMMYFMIPLLASSLIQQLYSTIDLLFVGKHLGTHAFSSIGISSLFITCLIGLLSGVTVGANILVSKALGAKRYSEIKGVVYASYVISIIGGISVLIVGVLLAPYYLSFINAPDVLRAESLAYIQIYLLASVWILFFNMSAGISKAVGNTRRPMLAQLIGSIVNIALNFVFVLGMKQGVQGVAWATFVGQFVAAAFMLKGMRTLSLGIAEPSNHTAVWKYIVSFGLAAGAQAMLITLSNIIVQSRINLLGPNYISAFIAYFKIELLIYLPIVAFGQALLTFVGQNYGANQPERITRYTKQMVMIASGVTFLFSLVVIAVAPMLFGLFTDQAEVIAIGVQIASTTFPFYVIYVFLQAFSDTLRGFGDVHLSTVIILINMCIIRPSVLSILFKLNGNVRSVAVTYPITWLTTALMLGIALWLKKPRRIHQMEEAYANK